MPTARPGSSLQYLILKAEETGGVAAYILGLKNNGGKP